MFQDYCTPILYAMLCSCLWALYPRIAALILGFCVKLSIFCIEFFCISVRYSQQTVLLVFTFNWCFLCFHVVVGLLFRNLVTRKTPNYYAVESDGCVPVLGSAQTVCTICIKKCLNYFFFKFTSFIQSPVNLSE